MVRPHRALAVSLVSCANLNLSVPAHGTATQGAGSVLGVMCQPKSECSCTWYGHTGRWQCPWCPMISQRPTLNCHISPYTKISQTFVKILQYQIKLHSFQFLSLLFFSFNLSHGSRTRRQAIDSITVNSLASFFFFSSIVFKPQQVRQG